MDTTDEVPDWAKLWLEPDVAAFLHRVADSYFNGDVNLALNEVLRINVAMYEKPNDMWAGIVAQNEAHVRALRVALPPAESR